MKVTPKTETEIQEMGLLAAGECSFEIMEAEDKISKSGNEMIVLTVQVFEASGRSKYIDDYLLDAIPHKVRHISEACGLLDKYEAGELHAIDFVSKTGHCKVGIQKDKTGAYPDKNVIRDYVIPKNTNGSHAPAASTRSNDLDDEIPF